MTITSFCRDELLAHGPLTADGLVELDGHAEVLEPRVNPWQAS